MRWPWQKKEDSPGYIPTVVKEGEPSVAVHEAIRISHAGHLLHIRAHHEQTVRLRNMPHGPDRDEAIKRHEKDAEDIRSYMRIHRPDEELRARFWQLQDRIEWLKAQPRTAETVAEIDELSKESTHIVHALPRADGSSGGPVGYTGPRPTNG